MKNHIIILTIVLLTFQIGYSQTNVNGGIYTNTTWTKANSPYIITGTIVVFPGVTLTIQPGVVVKFNKDMLLEIREASLIADGTTTDSITFKSNSINPTPGIWNQIFLNGGNIQSKFNYCNFQHAKKGIAYYSNAPLFVNNSNFNYNNYGIFGCDGGKGNVFIDFCDFNNNLSYGVDFTYSTSKISINHSNILNNGTGFSGLYEIGSIKNSIINSNKTGLFIHRILLENCKIAYNNLGIWSYSVNRIKNCIIDSNTGTGLIANGDSVVNCKIRYNAIGIHAAVSIIKGNIIENNSTGIYDTGEWGGSIVTENSIRFNDVGIDNIHERFIITKNILEQNSIGIVLNNSTSLISCNMICMNQLYDLKYVQSSNVNVANNYWCTSDSAIISAHIYDGFDNINSGLVSFIPLDHSCSPGIRTTTINENLDFSLNLFPNPTTGIIHVVYYGINQRQKLSIINSFGQFVTSLNVKSGEKAEIDLSNQPNGLYLIRDLKGGNVNKIIVNH